MGRGGGGGGGGLVVLAAIFLSCTQTCPSSWQHSFNLQAVEHCEVMCQVAHSMVTMLPLNCTPPSLHCTAALLPAGAAGIL